MENDRWYWLNMDENRFHLRWTTAPERRVQEFFLIPVGATTFAEAMKLGSETYHNLKAIIKKKYGFWVAQAPHLKPGSTCFTSKFINLNSCFYQVCFDGIWIRCGWNL